MEDILPNLTEEKWDLIKQAANMLNVHSRHLAAIIAFETAETFSPSIENPISKAVGLIQFTKTGFESIRRHNKHDKYGYKVRCNEYRFEDLEKMSFEKQLLGPVVAYFEANKGIGRDRLADLYMCVLWPAAVHLSSDFILFKKPSIAYVQNKGLDRDGKGFVTKQDAAAPVLRKYEKVLKRVNQFVDSSITFKEEGGI